MAASAAVAIGLVQILEKDVVSLQHAKDLSRKLPPQRPAAPTKNALLKKIASGRSDLGQKSGQLVDLPRFGPAFAGEHRQRQFAQLPGRCC